MLKMKKHMFLLGVILMGVAFLTACQHTVSGLGQDMQSNGKAIQRSASQL